MNAYCLVTFLHDGPQIFVIDRLFFETEGEALTEKGERTLRNESYKFLLLTFNAVDASII